MKEGRHNRAHRSVYVRMTWFAHCNMPGQWKGAQCFFAIACYTSYKYQNEKTS